MEGSGQARGGGNGSRRREIERGGREAARKCHVTLMVTVPFGGMANGGKEVGTEGGIIGNRE